MLINPQIVHVIFDVLAYACGIRLYMILRRGTIDFLTEKVRWQMIVCAILGAFAGSKILGYLSVMDLHQRHTLMEFARYNGKSIVGGLVGGALAVEVFKLFRGITRSTGDLFVTPLILGMSVGRIGCFMAGLSDGTYGLPTDLPWGVDFGDGIHRHPAQIYDIIFLGCLWLALRGFEKQMSEGLKFKIFFISYLTYRFFIEYLKPMPNIFYGVSPIQWFCLAGTVFYLPSFLAAIRVSNHRER